MLAIQQSNNKSMKKNVIQCDIIAREQTTITITTNGLQEKKKKNTNNQSINVNGKKTNLYYERQKSFCW
jgi:hypothetical protein